MIVYVLLWRKPSEEGWNLYGVFDNVEKAKDVVRELKERDVKLHGEEDKYKIHASNLFY